MNGYQIEALRHAREVAGEMRWQGMTVPPLYARMADEFQDLVRSGGYAGWVAAAQRPALTGRPSWVGGVVVRSQPSRSGRSRLAGHVRPAPAGRVARRVLPGPAVER